MPSPRTDRSRLYFTLLFGSLLLVQAWRLLLTPHGLVSTWTRNDDCTAVSTGGRGVAQEFTMGADGLDGLWVRPVSEGSVAGPRTGHLIVTLAERGPDGAVPILRQVVDARMLDTSAPVHLSFPEIRASRGRDFRVTLMHAGYEGADAVQLRARRSDALPDARFTVNDEEQWGDLLFETSAQRATLPYRKDEVLGQWPAWLRSWWGVAGVLVLFNLWLARVVATAVGLGAASQESEPADRIAAGAEAGGPRAAAIAAVTGIAVAGLVVAAWPVAPLEGIRLIERMPDARIDTTASSLHQGIAVEPVVILGRAYDAIVALPPSRLAWTLEVPTGALLVGHVAMRPDVWLSESDGANLVIVVEAGETRQEMARFTLVPFLIEAHRTLHEIRVPLEPWAGQTITLVLETDPERWGNAVNDVPVWIDPRIEWPRGAPRRTRQTAAGPVQRPASRR